MGGAEGFESLRKLRNFHYFYEKPTFLKLQGGAIKVGRMEGRKNGGANGWAHFGIHGGGMRGD